MKKYMIMCMAAIAILLSSCKNEDISISREVSFEVNPYGVISDFVNHQVHEDDFDFANGDWLRVHLFVYNANGNLVASDTQYLSGYRSTMNSTFELADGNYTVVATTDVATLNNGEVSFEYWEFTKADRLTDLRITDASGLIGWDDKILGVASNQVSVGAGHVSHTINVKPAGALILVHTNGIHNFSDVISYHLYVDKNSDFCSFESDGTMTPTINAGTTYNWQLSVQNTSSSGNNYYTYRFVLPLGNTNFIWFAKTEEDGSGFLLDDTHNLVNVRMGKMYNCVFDIPNLACDFYEFSNGMKDLMASDAENMRKIDQSSKMSMEKCVK